MLSESGADKPPDVTFIIQPPLYTYGCMRNIYLPWGLTYMAGSTIDTWVWLALVHLLITVITSIGRKAVTAVCPYEVLQTRQGREKLRQQTAATFRERGGEKQWKMNTYIARSSVLAGRVSTLVNLSLTVTACVPNVTPACVAPHNILWEREHGGVNRWTTVTVFRYDYGGRLTIQLPPFWHG